MSERLNYEENIQTAAAGGDDRVGTLPDELLQTSFHGGNLLDRMSKRLHDEGNMEKVVAGGEDRISALPDELLQYLMSFLLSRDAVRTCVLARRWRALWKSVPALRIDDPDSYHGATGSSKFVNELLRLRDPTPLNVCDISSDCREYANADRAEEAFRHMEPWLLYALFCQVPVLRICFPWLVINTTLVSSHLKRLHLYRMQFEECSLDFSSCQVLEVLEMKACHIHVDLLSQSLQHLKIHNTGFDFDLRVRISAPKLISFTLGTFWGLIPLVDSMPSLIAADVTLEEACHDQCSCGNESCEGCDAQASKTDYPLALGSLSVATNLKLKISGPRKLSVFSMDLKWRTTFSKLKTLLLNKWCVDDDFSGLVYFLQHSPILETLTLLLDFESSEDYHLNKTNESCNSKEQSLISQHLKKVKIICCTEEDVIVHRILKILCTHGVPFEKIEIELTCCSFGAGHMFDGMSERLNYEENIQTAAAGGEDRVGTLPDELLQTSFHGGNLLDRMSKRLHDEGNMEKVVAGGEDRISALPDELLQYLMSFLLSRDAVRTCVLARRWRTLWKSVPALRIDDPDSYHGATGSSKFVNELLRLRDPTPLNVCDISSNCQEDAGYDFDWAEDAFEHMEPWLCYALSCHVHVLRISFPWRVINMTLISSHLKRLHLECMVLEGCSLDFSSCEVLEVLEMRACDIYANILSRSLRHLKIHSGGFGTRPRVRISTPNLICFRLAPLWGWAPLLDSMPSLVTAAVKLQEGCEEACYCGNVSCEGCGAQAAKTDYSVALGSLSVATNLKLKISGPRRLSVFSKDLKWRPMFSKLKTLLLNKWCVGDDFYGLVYFLQHSPILETLTLLLAFETSEEYHLNKTDESCNSKEQSLLSQHLKKVKIICCTEEDVIVHRILKILCIHGVPFEKIETE
ncbi:hypothetical protein ACQJBY_057389 [Aegilops geniculata]